MTRVQGTRLILTFKRNGQGRAVFVNNYASTVHRVVSNNVSRQFTALIASMSTRDVTALGLLGFIVSVHMEY